jgi:ABC-type amino acid transport substrate-binding protein
LKGLAVLGVIVMFCALPVAKRLGPATAADQSILQKVLTTHTLTVAVLAGNPPWSFTKPDGELDGYEIAMAKVLAKGLGAKVEFIQTNGAGRIPAVQTHKADIGISDLNYSPERAQAIAYTAPYASTGNHLRVLASSPYKTVESLNSPNVNVGYSLGALEEKLLPALLPKAKFKAFTTESDVVEALVAHRIDAAGSETLSVALQMKERPGVFRMLDPSYFQGRVGIVVPYGDFDWWLYLNTWVERFNQTGDNQKLWLQYMKAGSPFE